MKRKLIKFNGVTVDVEPFILYRSGNKNDQLEAGWIIYMDDSIKLKDFNFSGYKPEDEGRHRVYVIPVDIHSCDDLKIIGDWQSSLPDSWVLYCVYTNNVDQNIKVEDMILHALSKGASIQQLRTLSYKIQNTGIENVSDMCMTSDKLLHIRVPYNNVFIHPDGTSHT